MYAVYELGEIIGKCVNRWVKNIKRVGQGDSKIFKLKLM